MKFIRLTEREWIQGKGYKKKILLKDEELHSSGALVQIVVIEPKDEVKSHYHNTSMEVFHIIDGEGTMMVDGKTFRLKAGDTLTCDPKMVHSARNISGNIFKFIVFKTNAKENDSVWLEE